MKKFTTILTTLLLLIVLVACSEMIEGPIEPPTGTPDDSIEHSVVISKLYGARQQENNIIELYNNSDKDVKLKDYTIDVYANGNDKITSRIKLKGTIEANSFYAIGSKQMEVDSIDQLDMKLKNLLPYNGDDAIVLAHKGYRVDTLGYVGHDINYSQNVTLIRLGEKEDFEPFDNFDPLNFIKYLPDVFQYLKNDNYTIKTKEQLLDGPRLSFEYKNMPYSSNGQATGGAPIATLTGIADGDTASFNFEGKPAGGSHRYYFINTAETAGPNTVDEPWGEIGSFYNKEFLLNDAENKEIRIQSIPKNALTDTYGRNLGLVWINDQLSQFLIVKEGLSLTFSKFYDETNLALHYEDVPYVTFLLFAEKLAQDNGWGIHGEESPDWDYENNKRAPKGSWDDWTPHNDINW